MSEYEGLTDEQVAAERELLRGLPPVNIGALFLPPVWGPGHGQWWTIIWYPVWAFCDTAFYLGFVGGAKGEVAPWATALAAVLLLLLALVTVVYARLSQPFALHRALDRGASKERYAATERKWAVACVAIGIVFLVVATWFNLCVRPGLVAA